MAEADSASAMSDECPKCRYTMKLTVSRVHGGLVLRRCTNCGESDFAWLTAQQMAGRAECSVGEIKQVLATMFIEVGQARGDGDGREFSPDVQTKAFAEIRRKVQDGWSGGLAGGSCR